MLKISRLCHACGSSLLSQCVHGESTVTYGLSRTVCSLLDNKPLQWHDDSGRKRRYYELVKHLCGCSVINQRYFSGTITCQKKTVGSVSSDTIGELSDKDNDMLDLIADEVLFDYADKQYILPDSGHCVFLLQPDDKTTPKWAQQTSAIHRMEEAQALVETLPNWTVLDKAVYSTRAVKRKAIFGKGKFEEITRHIRSTQTVSAVFVGVDMLSGAQLQYLQDAWGLPVYDRYTIVLQIFHIHARTKVAKLQVALAEIPYMRSRLRGLHEGTLDQQRGGHHSIGGSGETFLETRYRLLQDREMKLRRTLDKVKGQRELLRSNRVKKQIPVIALVGYTNSGKTTLIKAVSGDQKMEPRDQLFATLDVTAHGAVLPNKMNVVFMDTVGFISDIPTSLIESFSATLEDALCADLVIHIRDISHPDTEMQKAQVLETLRGLDLSEKLLKNVVEVCNKSDKLDSSTVEALRASGALCVSATQSMGLAALLAQVQHSILTNTDRLVKKFKVPMDGQHLSWLHKESTVQDTIVCEDSKHVIVETIITRAAYGKFKTLFKSATGTK